MSNDPKKPHTAADDLEDHVEAPLHEAVFGNDPDGFVNDTPRGAIGDGTIWFLFKSSPASRYGLARDRLSFGLQTEAAIQIR